MTGMDQSKSSYAHHETRIKIKISRDRIKILILVEPN